MEQLTLTLKELNQEEQKIRDSLGGIVKSFVRTGWSLSRIDRSGAYKLKGFRTTADYAAATFGMSPGGVSRFINVYEKYSVPGDTPELKEEYREYNFSQLVEMLQLPDSDHTMIRPESKREDIRELARFNKENENNPDKLLNWQQDPDDILKEAAEAFFQERKNDLNQIYAEYGISPYTEEEIKNMSMFLFHGKAKRFRSGSIFMILYEDQIFVKGSDGEPRDITYAEFFQAMGEVFDGDAGEDTWKNYFEPEEIPGQGNIMNHPEYLPGKLHEKRFENCIYHPEEECIAGDCAGCQRKKEKTLPKLKKPDEVEREYLNAAARNLIVRYKSWMLEDLQNRVMNVDRSPKELKDKIGIQQRTGRYFSTEKGTAHINLFEDYVQLWDEKNVCVGDFDWFYLAAAIQSMWNVIAMEEAARMQEPEEENDIQQKKEEEEIAPAQPDAWPEDLNDIPVPLVPEIKAYLQEEENILKEYLEIEDLPERTIKRQQWKVAGLRIIRNLTEDAGESETDDQEQQPLPKLKNNEERKEWLRNYKEWPLRHTDSYTGAKYYEYRFDNGAVLVAEVWEKHGDRYLGDYETSYLHLIGGPEPPKGQYGQGKWERHETFNRYPDNETGLVEFLKEIQR